MKRIQKKWLMVLIAIAMMVSLVTVVGAADPEIEANYGFIPNSGEASVSKVELTTFVEVARYYTAPRNTPPPGQWRTSRIAMDKDGNAWVINTGADGTNLQGSIVRIQADTTGLETHLYPDDVLAFGTDDAVQVFEVGAPGEMPRAIAIDAEGYIWVGFYSGGYLQKYEYNEGELTAVEGPFRYGTGDSNNIKFYEMKFAPDGTLWISSRSSTPARPGTEGIFSFDGGTLTRENVANPYSLLIADDGTVYATAYSNALHIRDPDTGTWSSVTITGSSQNRGMAFDDYGRIWIASTVGTTGGTVVYSYNITEGIPGPTYTLTSGTTPVGVGKDAAGNMWAVCRSDAMSQGWIEGFNPETRDKVGAIQVGHRPYAYGDFVVITPPKEELTVTKTAETSFTREHFWDIDKLVYTDNGYTIGEEAYPKIWLYTNGDGDESATWIVDVTYEGYVDSDFTVSGTITIENTGDIDVEILEISDWLEYETESGSAELFGTPTLTCDVELPYTLNVGDTLECEYWFSFEDKAIGTNYVKVTTGTNDDGYSAETGWSWGDPDEEVNETVTIIDYSDLFGEVDLGEVIAPNNWTFLHTEDFAWADYGADGCGSFTYDNTATVVETGQDAKATLKVNVQKYVFDGETAWAANEDVPLELRYTTRGNWATYVEYFQIEKTTTLFAGQTIPVGTVTFSDCVGEKVTITVTLEDGWEFEDVGENLKVQDYEIAPSGNPAPGLFAHKKYCDPDDASCSIVVPCNNFYGVHVNVGQWIPDPTFGPLY